MRFNVLSAATLLCLAVLAQPVSSRTALAQEAGGPPGGGPDGAPDGGAPGGPGGGGGPDAGAAAKTRLDTVLSVLRNHQRDAGKACLDAMTEVHQTEDQVASLGQQDSTSHTDGGADIARDVLESDYETAEAACHPDAERACRADLSDRNCGKLMMGEPR